MVVQAPALFQRVVIVIHGHAAPGFYGISPYGKQRNFGCLTYTYTGPDGWSGKIE